MSKRTKKNAHHHLLESIVTSLIILFCLTKKPKPEEIQFTMCDKEKQEILLFDELEPEDGWHFFTISGWKITETMNQLSK